MAREPVGSNLPRYDLVVIGSGPAGEKGAAQAAYFGKRVALVEAQPCLGGAATNTGTLPSKTLRESALYLSGLRQRGLHGVDYSAGGSITIDLFMHRKRCVVAEEIGRIQRNLDRHGIELVSGRACLESPHVVRVEGPGGTSRRLEAEFILIATGSYPHQPGEMEFDGRTICDSDQILQLETIPASLAVIGAGVIGCEYACIFAALGVKVILIDGRPNLLPFLDGQVSRALRDRMAALGIELRLAVSPGRIQRRDGEVEVAFADAGTLRVNALLYAAGRRGNSDGLGLEAIGVQPDGRGNIPVNGHFQTSVPNVYAAGDVIGFPALASTAMEQGRLAACHAFELRYKTRLAPVLPYGIYTIPEVSCAGETEESLQRKGRDYLVGVAGFSGKARGQIIGELEGFIKLIFDPEDRRLLGVHLIGESATELVHVGALCLQLQGTLDTFIECVFNYPTLSEAYKYAAYDGLNRIALRRKAASG